METTFVLDALEQALWVRQPSGTVHHSDKGSQYVSLAYTQRLKEAGLLALTGSTGDSYDNAMAESINGLYKAEVIHRKSWKKGDADDFLDSQENEMNHGSLAAANRGVAEYELSE